jgi:hypothetical protein
MALPSSGPISINDIYTELFNGNCCESYSYSLRDLSACAGFSSPDAMSEFYGYSCTYAIAVDAKYISSPFNEATGDYALYYSINLGSDTILVYGSSISTTCDTMGTISVPIGASLQLGFAVVPSSGKDSGRQYDIAETTDCPATSTNYCGTYGSGQGQYYSTTPTATGKRYMTIAVFTKTGTFLTCA